MNTKSISLIACLSVFILPLASLIVLPGTIVWYPQCIALIALGFIIASAFIWQENKPLALLSLYCLYSYIFVCNQHPRAMLCLIMAYGGIAIICAVGRVVNTGMIYKSILGVAVLQFILVVLQYFNLDPFFHLTGHENLSETVGFLGSKNQLAVYYCAIAPIIARFSYPLLSISLIPIFLSHCSAAAVGFIGGAFFYMFQIGRTFAIIFFSAILIMSCVLWSKFDTPLAAFKERVKIWELTYKQVTSGKAVMDMGHGANKIVSINPLTGAGIGSFLMISPATQGKVIHYTFVHRYEHAHNDLVEFLFEFGWLGLPILAFLIFNILKNLLSVPMTINLMMIFSSLIAQAVSSLGVYIIHAPVSYFMLCLTLGLFYGEVRNARIGFQKT